MPEPGTITRAVNAIAAGDVPTTSDPAVAQVYVQLKALAGARLRKDPAAALEPTELVHEVVLKLFRPGQGVWESRGHFFGCAARAVQQLLIDDARKRRSTPKFTPDLDRIAAKGRDPVALSGAIEALQEHDPLLAEVVRLRVFAGLSVEDTAEVLGKSPRTVNRYWTFACAWLVKRLGERDV